MRLSRKVVFYHPTNRDYGLIKHIINCAPIQTHSRRFQSFPDILYGIPQERFAFPDRNQDSTHYRLADGSRITLGEIKSKRKAHYDVYQAYNLIKREPDYFEDLAAKISDKLRIEEPDAKVILWTFILDGTLGFNVLGKLAIKKKRSAQSKRVGELRDHTIL